MKLCLGLIIVQNASKVCSYMDKECQNCINVTERSPAFNIEVKLLFKVASKGHTPYKTNDEVPYDSNVILQC